MFHAELLYSELFDTGRFQMFNIKPHELLDHCLFVQMAHLTKARTKVTEQSQNLEINGTHLIQFQGLPSVMSLTFINNDTLPLITIFVWENLIPVVPWKPQPQEERWGFGVCNYLRASRRRRRSCTLQHCILACHVRVVVA